MRCSSYEQRHQRIRVAPTYTVLAYIQSRHVYDGLYNATILRADDPVQTNLLAGSCTCESVMEQMPWGYSTAHNF